MQPQLPDGQEGGDDAAVEPHGKQDQDVEQLLAVEITEGQRVGGDAGQKQAQRAAGQGDKEAVADGAPDILVGKDQLV